MYDFMMLTITMSSHYMLFCENVYNIDQTMSCTTCVDLVVKDYNYGVLKMELNWSNSVSFVFY